MEHGASNFELRGKLYEFGGLLESIPDWIKKLCISSLISTLPVIINLFPSSYITPSLEGGFFRVTKRMRSVDICLYFIPIFDDFLFMHDVTALPSKSFDG